MSCIHFIPTGKPFGNAAPATWPTDPQMNHRDNNDLLYLRLGLLEIRNKITDLSHALLPKAQIQLNMPITPYALSIYGVQDRAKGSGLKCSNFEDLPTLSWNRPMRCGNPSNLENNRSGFPSQDHNLIRKFSSRRESDPLDCHCEIRDPSLNLLLGAVNNYSHGYCGGREPKPASGARPWNTEVSLACQDVLAYDIT